MKRVALSEIAELIMGQSPPSSAYNMRGEGLPFFQGKADFGDLYPTARVFCTEPKKTAEAGDILISVRAPVGPTNINPHKSCIGRGLAAIRASKDADTKYLLYFLRFYESRLVQAGTGSTFEAISRDDLEDIRVPFLPLPEQRRHAAILDKADRLRRLRRYALELSDTYLQSVFLEMFGGLQRNPRLWKFRELGSLADIASGVTKGQKYNGKATVEVPYLRVANVQDGYLDLSEIKTIQALPSEVEELRLQVGDIVMTEGGDFDKLGRGAIWRGQIENCIHQNHIFRVRLDISLVLPEFFEQFLLSRYAKDYFLKASKQTTNLATINMTQLKGLLTPLPPMDLQSKFARIMQGFEHLRIQQREADRQAEHLFQTLLHRAFVGELWL